MKKLILSLALVVGFSTLLSAQDFSGRLGTADKVFANALADTITITISKSRSAITFHNQVTKNSGAVAGTIVIQAKTTTIAGERWVTLDSHTITDATQDDWVTFTHNQALQYRLIRTTTGTQNSTINSFLLYRE